MVPVGHYPGDDLKRIHIVLWQNQPVRDMLGVLLAGQPRLPYTYAAVDSLDATGVDVVLVHVLLVALDAAGQPLPNAYATPVGLNPRNLDRTQYLLDADGRGTMRLSRGNIPPVQGGLGRFGVQFHWQESGEPCSSKPLIMARWTRSTSRAGSSSPAPDGANDYKRANQEQAHNLVQRRELHGPLV